MLAIGALGILAFATLLLVIPGTASPSDAAPISLAPMPPAAIDEFAASARVVDRPSQPPDPGTPKKSSGSRIPAAPGASIASNPLHATSPQKTGPALSLPEAAAVCTELGRVSQSIEIAALLERAAKVLNASGVIVWMATADRYEIYPAASAGYDERLLVRIGSIKRDAANVTAAALRDASARVSPRVGSSAAALAVPLMTPLGPVGVFSAEIRDLETVDEARLAIATIFAAQLATLLGSMSAADTSSTAATAVKAQA
jgi:hypothetical protein